jgi:mRNA-degrading endonuclease RelE of RelBE toxin-antitoxin system
VTSKKEKWEISKISNSARKNIENLDIETQEKIISRLDCLLENPWKGDIKKVQGKKNIYREKIDEYRFYFRIFPESKTIEVLLFDYRGRVKRKTIQRLK